MSSEHEPGTFVSTPEPGATSAPEPEAELTTIIPAPRINIIPDSEPTTAEPVAEASAEPVTTSIWDTPFAEPVPDWELAKPQLGTAWELHVYGIGTTFAILAILSFISIVVIATIPKLKSRGYFIMMNVLIFIFGFVRAIYMFVDAYNARHSLSPIVAYISINIGYPCLTTMFYILFSALFQLTKFRQMNSRIFSKRYLIGISVGFFVLQFTADIVVGFFLKAWLLAFLCEVFFVLWGLMFSILFIVVFARLVHATVAKRRLMQSIAGSRGSLDAAGRNYVSSATHLSVAQPDKHGSNASLANRGKDKTPRVDTTVKISALAVVFFILLSFAHVYGLMSANSLATQETPDPWPWWTYNFVLRILELCMAFTVLFVASGPVRMRRSLLEKAKKAEWTPSVTASRKNSPAPPIHYVQTINNDIYNSMENMVTVPVQTNNERQSVKSLERQDSDEVSGTKL